VPRPATVRVVHTDGTLEERDIVIGVASRVAAEVISGLEVGDRVIAGIIQADAPDASNNANRNQNFRGPQAIRFF
jgi:macrolide-specific efflux system membrane fusion protein